MRECKLKYGCNPDQKAARIFMRDDSELPLTILNGRPGYINFLDALNSWQLVRELRKCTGLPSAASFKHVSPVGAALGLKLSDSERRLFFVDESLPVNDSPIACAYIRARGTDRLSSFGDWIALSDECDEVAAEYIRHEVSDGIIAPSYTREALEILKTKRKGNYAVVRIAPDYEPESTETREVFGITFEQTRSTAPVIEPEKFDSPITANKDIPESARRDLVLALVTLKYTQSNSVCVTKDGQTLGVGAGQQSRVHCVRLACDKADLRLLREMPEVLNHEFAPDFGRPERDNAIDSLVRNMPAEKRREYLAGISGAALGSDAFFPFPDNIERAAQSGVKYVAQPGGSIRDDLVIRACDEYGMAMVMTGHRLFHH